MLLLNSREELWHDAWLAASAPRATDDHMFNSSDEEDATEKDDDGDDYPSSASPLFVDIAMHVAPSR